MAHQRTTVCIIKRMKSRTCFADIINSSGATPTCGGSGGDVKRCQYGKVGWIQFQVPTSPTPISSTTCATLKCLTVREFPENHTLLLSYFLVCSFAVTLQIFFFHFSLHFLLLFFFFLMSTLHSFFHSLHPLSLVLHSFFFLLINTLHHHHALLLTITILLVAGALLVTGRSLVITFLFTAPSDGVVLLIGGVVVCNARLLKQSTTNTSLVMAER